MFATRGKPPAEEPPDPHHPRPPEDFPVKLSLKLEPEEKDTDLARICSNSLNELPQLVKVGERFKVPGNDVTLEKGECLLLLFIAELPRVHAVDMSNKSELWLPVYAEQVYERLPLDPLLDYKFYVGAAALINAKPKPSVVRVVEGYGSDDYTECVDREDIIEISHIEEKNRRHGKEKVLIARNQIGHRLELHKDMYCAQFTTMMSAEFLHMSELIKLHFPQRVRVVEETNSEKRKPKEEKVLNFLSYKKDLQVIATRTKKPALLSIPITVPLSVSVTSFKEKTVQTCLPALFPPVNLTWGFKEVGRPELPDQQREISQPLPEPVRVWINSCEGKELACEVAHDSKADLKREIEELIKYNKNLSDRVSFLGQAGRPVVPDREAEMRAHTPPQRPPKPARLRTLSTPPTDKQTSTPEPKPRLLSTSDVKKIPKYEPSHRSASASNGYEVTDPPEFSDEEENDYEEVPDVGENRDNRNKNLQKTCEDLKSTLQQKDKIKLRLIEQNNDLERTFKKLMQEKESIKHENIKRTEGKERACKVARVSKADLKVDLKKLTNYNEDLSDRVAFLGQAGRPVVPDRETVMGAHTPPPRPPKPARLRTFSTPHTDKKPGEDKPRSTPEPKPRSLSTSDIKKIPSACLGTSANDGYEVIYPPKFSDEKGNDYVEMPDAGKNKNAGTKTLKETCEELKRILQEKEKIIAKLNAKKKDLEEECKKSEQETESIRRENIKRADEIIRLQAEIDNLVSKDYRKIYDVIHPKQRPLPILPTSADAVIYSTPDSLLVERACLSRTDAEGVADLLRQLGLSRYVERFQEEEIDGALLTTLDETVLKEDLGMTGLHARKLLLRVKKQSK